MTTPSDFGRLAIRAAAKIHERLSAPARLNGIDRFPGAEWDRLRRTIWRHRKVEVRGWHAAARELVQDLDYQTLLLINQLEMLRAQLPRATRASQIAAPSQIVADLAALADEFESVQIDLKERTVTVQTEPIELEELWLGPFDIRLWWERLGVRRAYEVVAKDPQRPSRDESVTHPHVRDDLLCEGDAALPIKAALASGQIFDFFLVVRQTLETYNSSSPYVGIEDWQAVRCRDCGSRLGSDDAFSCDQCNDQLCGECSTCCQGCNQYVCHSCCSECAECENTFCSVCLTRDVESRRLLCESCLDQGTANEDDDDQQRPAAEADAVCLGQTATAA